MKRQVASELHKTLHGAPVSLTDTTASPVATSIPSANTMVDSKREAEKLIKAKASSYTTVKKRISTLIEILQEDGGAQTSTTKTIKVDGRKRDKKRQGKNQAMNTPINRNSSFSNNTQGGNKSLKRQKTWVSSTDHWWFYLWLKFT